MSSETATATFFMLLPSAPIMLVYLAGIIVALSNASRHHKPAMYALAGFIALLVSAIVRAGGLIMTLPQYRGDMSLAELSMRLTTINLGAGVLAIAGTILILVAVFAGREQKSAAAGCYFDVGVGGGASLDDT